MHLTARVSLRHSISVESRSNNGNVLIVRIHPPAEESHAMIKKFSCKKRFLVSLQFTTRVTMRDFLFSGNRCKDPLLHSPFPSALSSHDSCSFFSNSVRLQQCYGFRCTNSAWLAFHPTPKFLHRFAGNTVSVSGLPFPGSIARLEDPESHHSNGFPCSEFVQSKPPSHRSLTMRTNYSTSSPSVSSGDERSGDFHSSLLANHSEIHSQVASDDLFEFDDAYVDHVSSSNNNNNNGSEPVRMTWKEEIEMLRKELSWNSNSYQDLDKKPKANDYVFELDESSSCNGEDFTSDGSDHGRSLQRGNLSREPELIQVGNDHDHPIEERHLGPEKKPEKERGPSNWDWKRKGMGNEWMDKPEVTMKKKVVKSSNLIKLSRGEGTIEKVALKKSNQLSADATRTSNSLTETKGMADLDGVKGNNHLDFSMETSPERLPEEASERLPTLDGKSLRVTESERMGITSEKKMELMSNQSLDEFKEDVIRNDDYKKEESGSAGNEPEFEIANSGIKVDTKGYDPERKINSAAPVNSNLSHTRPHVSNENRGHSMEESGPRIAVKEQPNFIAIKNASSNMLYLDTERAHRQEGSKEGTGDKNLEMNRTNEVKQTMEKGLEFQIKNPFLNSPSHANLLLKLDASMNAKDRVNVNPFVILNQPTGLNSKTLQFIQNHVEDTRSSDSPNLFTDSEVCSNPVSFPPEFTYSPFSSAPSDVSPLSSFLSPADSSEASNLTANQHVTQQSSLVSSDGFRKNGIPNPTEAVSDVSFEMPSKIETPSESVNPPKNTPLNFTKMQKRVASNSYTYSPKPRVSKPGMDSTNSLALYSPARAQKGQPFSENVSQTTSPSLDTFSETTQVNSTATNAMDKALPTKISAVSKSPKNFDVSSLPLQAVNMNENTTIETLKLLQASQNQSRKNSQPKLINSESITDILPSPNAFSQPDLPSVAKPHEKTYEYELEGVINRVVFQNKETGYTIVRVTPTEESISKISGMFQTSETSSSATRQRNLKNKKSRKKEPSKDELRTFSAKGKLIGVSVGQFLKLCGNFMESENWGNEFLVESFSEVKPKDLLDIQKYLGGGLIKGIGLKTSKLIVDHFGKSVFDVLDSENAEKEMTKVKGIGKMTAKKIVEVWKTNKLNQESNMFLISNGFPSTMASSLINTHGLLTKERLLLDPWRSIEGVCENHFEIIDDFAKKHNINMNALSRYCIALNYTLYSECLKNGHCFLPWHKLSFLTKRLLLKRAGSGNFKFEESKLKQALLTLHCKGVIMIDDKAIKDYGKDEIAEILDIDLLNVKEWGGNDVDGDDEHRIHDKAQCVTLKQCETRDQEFLEEEKEIEDDSTKLVNNKSENEIATETERDLILNSFVSSTPCYVYDLYIAENEVARNLLSRIQQKSISSDMNRVAKWVERHSQNPTMRQLSVEQRKAVEFAAYAHVFVLTGGPGCGKTYTTQTIVKLWQSMGLNVMLCAPTGRAAQRLADSVGMRAKTIHRLLEYRQSGTETSDDQELEAFKDLNMDDKAVDPPSENDAKRSVNDSNDIESFDFVNRKKFGKNAYNQLDVNAIVIDETSMLDLPLAAALLSAIPMGAQILFVGDIDQLPPVGPGLILRDIIKCQKVPIFRLTEVFRQAQKSFIVKNAHEINKGKVPVFESIKPYKTHAFYGNHTIEKKNNDETTKIVSTDNLTANNSDNGGNMSLNFVKQEKWWEDMKTDCLWIEANTEEEILQGVKDAIQKLAPFKKFEPFKDVQLLSPTRKGALGVIQFNNMIQNILNPFNPKKIQIERSNFVYRVGDRVIQLKNDYEKDIFNGDLGEITHIDEHKRRLKVKFSGIKSDQNEDGKKEIYYDFRALNELELAWAITVHKSQGSEYPVVILPLSAQHGKLLSRKLLYTALTRAKNLAVLVGPKISLEFAIQTVRDDARFSNLLPKLVNFDGIQILR